MKKQSFILFLSVVFANTALARPQDLVTTYLQAVENDAVLQQALATQLATQQGVPIAFSQLLPQASVLFYTQADSAIGFGAPGTVPVTFEQTNIDRSYGYIANATQNIIDLGVFSNINEARLIAQEADATFLASEQDLIYRVANAYFNILLAEDTVDFVVAQKEALAAQLEQTQQRFNVGLVAITDVYDFQAQYDTEIANEIAARNTVSDTKESLQVITGIPVDDVLPLKTEIPLLSPDPIEMETWVRTAEYNNPTLASDRYNMQAAEEAISTARAQHYPNLSVAVEYDGTYGGQVFDPQGGAAQGWGIGLESGINLYSGGAISSQVRQAEYQYEASKDMYEEQRRLTVSNTRTAYRNIDAAMSQVKAFEQAVFSSQTALDSNIAAYEAGTKTSVDVLDSISLLYQQKQNLANAKYNYILSILALKQAAGILEVMDLIRMNEWLQLALED